MKYFQKISENNNLISALNVVQRHDDEWWNLDTVRTGFDGSPHAQADDILLRSCVTSGRSLMEMHGDLEATDRETLLYLPELKKVALDLMRFIGGTRLGRMVITRLRPGDKITPHADEGPYAAYYSRYHVVLQGLPGSVFHCGDEAVQMLTGEIWWFNHRVEHFVVNNSKDDRIHLIVDAHVDEQRAD